MKTRNIYSVLSLVLLITVSFFTYQFIQNGENDKSTKKPKSLLYSEKFGEQKPISQPALSIEKGITNIRLNNVSGVSEPKAAINPNDELNVVAASNDFMLSGNGARFFYSLDGGMNWNSKVVPLSGLSGYDDATDPSITFDADGTIYYAMIHYQLFGSGDGLFVNKSIDKGLTWNQTATEVKKNSDAVIFEDRPSITADVSNSLFRNNIYVIWTSIGRNSNQILFAKSTDGANSFSSPLVLAEGIVHTADIKVDNNGRIFAAYLVDNSKMAVRKSLNGGDSFEQSVIASTFEHSGELVNNQYLLKRNSANNGIRIKSYPSLAIDQNSNEVYLVYSAKNGNDLSDVFMVKSLDNGTTWSDAIRVNNDNGTADQFMPEIAVVNGKIYIAFQDSRNDNSNNSVETYLAVSQNNGNDFDNTLISTSSFNPSNILLGNYIGDYIGLAVSKSVVIPVWTDGRNNNFDLYSSIISNSVTDIKENSIPSSFSVEQNYPNPFNPSTILSFSIPNEGNVTIKLYDITGKELAVLLNSNLTSGKHSLDIDFSKISKGLSSGTYLYSIKNSGITLTKKMIFAK
jgi:hypothetical protein